MRIVDDLVDKDVARIVLFKETGNRVESSERRGTVAAFAIDKSIFLCLSPPSHRQRGSDATSPDRRGKFLEFRVIEELTRLVWIGLDQGQFDQVGVP